MVISMLTKKTEKLLKKAAFDRGEDDRKATQALFSNLKTKLPKLIQLLEDCNGHWAYEDLVYRFYHKSFKVYGMQMWTKKIVKYLQALSPKTRLDNYFSKIVRDGTGKKFDLSHNSYWTEETRPIVEAFFHARYFLEMAVKYGRDLEKPPQMLPSGWASFLCLYNLR